MFHLFKVWFMNRRIRSKVLVCMTALVLLGMSAVGYASSFTYSHQYMEQVNVQTNAMFDSSTKLLQSNVFSLYRSVVSLTARPIFHEVGLANQSQSFDARFMPHYQQLATLFSDFIANTPWVQELALLCPNGSFYSTYGVGLNHSIEEFEEELAQTSISWLPMRQNPLLSRPAPAVPLCFPLQVGSGQISFCNDQPADMTLVLYLDLQIVERALEQISSTSYTSVYLADAAGKPITLSPESPLYGACSQADFCQQLCQDPQRRSFNAKLDGQPYRITCQRIRGSGLYVVSCFSYQAVHQSRLHIWNMTGMVILFTIIPMILLAAFLSSSITVPVHNLLGQVAKVRRGCFQISPVTHYQDEIHELDTALCELAGTIGQQIGTIRREEALRRKAELAAISEQINQHFLYNTLDCIYWNILNDHPQNAADMVESLGQFLRISLNQGKDLLDFAQALRHTQQYVNIMNVRFGAHIHFTYTIAPELGRQLLPKSIFQPLVENSILHGFGGSAGDPAITAPAIDIQARVQQGQGVVVVSDNGRGFDPDGMQAAISTPSQHVGLYNVAKRLSYVFGSEVRFSFSSIPYYRSEIRIQFPLRPPTQGKALEGPAPL